MLSQGVLADAAEALKAGLDALTAEFQDDELREAIALGLTDIEAGRVREYFPGDVMAHFERAGRSAKE